MVSKYFVKKYYYSCPPPRLIVSVSDLSEKNVVPFHLPCHDVSDYSRRSEFGGLRVPRTAFL